MGEGVTRRGRVVVSWASSSGRGRACPEVDRRQRERLEREARGDQHLVDHVDDAVRREHVRHDNLGVVDLEGVQRGHLYREPAGHRDETHFQHFSMVIARARAPRKRRLTCWPRERTMKHARKAEG